MSKFNVGDKVAYSVKFLRSIGEGLTSPLCHARGEITEIKEYSSKLSIASIKWENDYFQEFAGKVNCFNLAKVPGSKTVREDGSVGTVLPNAAFCAC